MSTDIPPRPSAEAVEAALTLSDHQLGRRHVPFSEAERAMLELHTLFCEKPRGMHLLRILYAEVLHLRAERAEAQEGGAQ